MLRDVNQAVMGWFDYHLWGFRIGKHRNGLPVDEDWGTEPRRQAAKVRLRYVLKPTKTTIDYLYDFGDGWEHRLVVTGVRAGDPEISYPRYVGGERNAPPENCRGIPGFYDMLEALTEPDHPNHADASEWADEYDSGMVDELPIKYAFARLIYSFRHRMIHAPSLKSISSVRMLPISPGRCIVTRTSRSA